MHTALDLINEAVEELKDHTRRGLQSQRNELWRKLDTFFTQYRNELMADSMNKKEKDDNPANKERTLAESLELMTLMAQDLDI